MKKILVALLVLCVAWFAAPAFAEEGDPVCESGFHFDTDANMCVADPAPVACTPPQVYDSQTAQCVIPEQRMTLTQAFVWFSFLVVGLYGVSMGMRGL